MKKQHIGILMFVLLLALATLSCALTGAAEPTQAPPPPAAAEPTQAPAQPTAEAPGAAPTEASPAEPTAPPADNPPTEPPEAPSTPPPSDVIAVDAIRGYRDTYGSLNIIGLVTNYTDRAVDGVEVEIEIFDANNTSLYKDVTTISLNALLPGETSPFTYWTSDEIPNADHYAATIVGQSVSGVERLPVTLEGTTLTVDDDYNMHITGNLVNNNDVPVEISSIAAATFDENGDLFSADAQTVVIRYLDPGESGPFRVTMSGHESDSANTNIRDFQVYIDSRVATPEEVYDLALPETHYNYIDAYNSFHLVGEITNNEDYYLTVSLVAGIYDADGKVLDAATTDIPTFSIGPGETLPYDFTYWGPLNYKADLFNAAASYTVQWDPYWTWDSTDEHVELSTQNDTNEVSSFQVEFTGEVLNDSGEEVSSATVIISLYDVETGELVATGYGGIYEPIPVNTVADYVVWVDIPVDFDINNVNYTILVYGDL